VIKHDRLVALINEQMRQALDDQNLWLNEALFRSFGPPVVASRLPWQKRAWRKVAGYLDNLRQGIVALGRALIGRPAIPDCDCDGF